MVSHVNVKVCHTRCVPRVISLSSTRAELVLRNPRLDVGCQHHRPHTELCNAHALVVTKIRGHCMEISSEDTVYPYSDDARCITVRKPMLCGRLLHEYDASGLRSFCFDVPIDQHVPISNTLLGCDHDDNLVGADGYLKVKYLVSD